ncbi:UNVERIFIED_CONTAM: hypothetical protein Scaly_2217200 [Sesamum calycinum]|uniref:Histone-lysine N-methyltransferase NSD-like PHD zinc finger 1 domain-containing protein n=1 Tax=Sesamum calycinum TaxID=2727403 RepID=A0AAW2MBN1_9LAMI
MDKVNTQAKDNTQANVIDIYFWLFSVAKSKDMDSGEIVVFSIQTGMKREFAMMMKVQSEIGGLPAGGRRMTRSQSTAGSSKDYVRSADKADLVVGESREAEKVVAELREDMPLGIESTVPQFRGTDGDSTHEDERPVGETTDLRMKMSKKVELSRILTKLKYLLQTGLLEGLPVCYIHGSKNCSTFSAPSPLGGPSAPACSSRPPVVSESAQISSESQPQMKRQVMLTRNLRLMQVLLPVESRTCVYTLPMECLCIELSKSRKSSTEEFDDLCSICEDGGDLLCCESCPRGFHTECVDLSYSPRDMVLQIFQNMFEKEKFADQMQIYLLLEESLVLYLLYFFLSGSAFGNSVEICFFRRHDFCKSRFTARTFIICDQAELPKGDWFCCRPCNNINSAVQNLIGDGEQRLPEALSDVLKMKCEGQDLHKNPELGIR